MTSCHNESLGRLIYRTSLELRNYAEKLLSPYGLTVEQYHLLKSTSAEEGLSQNQLCQEVGKKPANITRILDRLEIKGWVERRPHPDDRRSSLVFLTQEGERISAEVHNDFESYSSWFTKGIDQGEEQICRRVLQKIDSNLRKLMSEIEC